MEEKLAPITIADVVAYRIQELVFDFFLNFLSENFERHKANLLKFSFFPMAYILLFWSSFSTLPPYILLCFLPKESLFSLTSHIFTLETCVHIQLIKPLDCPTPLHSLSVCRSLAQFLIVK